MSAWASKWMTPTLPGPWCSATAVMFGSAIEWSPPSTTGIAPAAQISATRWRIASWLRAVSPGIVSASP